MLALPDRDVEGVLAIIAHPHDAEFWGGWHGRPCGRTRVSM